jgi:MoxR-like ATPase
MSAGLPAVHVEQSVRAYVISIARATREHAAAELGASPRATLSLFRAARAYAPIRGRDYVIPDDVQQLAGPVLAHRIMLSSQSRLRGRDSESLVREVLEQTQVPVEG